jgi:hypothetical protein
LLAGGVDDPPFEAGVRLIAGVEHFLHQRAALLPDPAETGREGQVRGQPPARAAVPITSWLRVSMSSEPPVMGNSSVLDSLPR